MAYRSYSLSKLYNLYSESFKEDKYYLFNLEDGAILRLNKTAHDIIALFDGKRSKADILEKMMEKYDAPLAEITKDIDNVINMCLEKGIITSREV